MPSVTRLLNKTWVPLNLFCQWLVLNISLSHKRDCRPPTSLQFLFLCVVLLCRKHLRPRAAGKYIKVAYWNKADYWLTSLLKQCFIGYAVNGYFICPFFSHFQIRKNSEQNPHSTFTDIPNSFVGHLNLERILERIFLECLQSTTLLRFGTSCPLRNKDRHQNKLWQHDWLYETIFTT